MKVTIAGLLITTFACCFATPVPPTRRPETPVYDDDEHQDPYFHERQHPFDEATWALWNQQKGQCPWWQQHRYLKFLKKIFH